MTAQSFTSGDQIGAYRMQKQIGAGGMGEVWLAEHTLLGRRAAIKLLHATYSSQPEIVARFFNEARAATAIADPGIVQIFDFGHDNGVAYIVMEMLEGETLEARRHRGMSVSDALRIMRQVAGSLGAAHARGIIHRDLKPENIFLVRDPEVAGGERAKILDFGIAKLTGDSTVKTQTSAVMGTPMFMSPEQCRGAGQVDQRADIYSLGCVLFTLITGRPVFIADGVGDLIVKHITEQAPRVSSLLAVPEAIDELVARCLEKDPARRPGSGAALAALLGALLADSQVMAVLGTTPDRSAPPSEPGPRRAAETAAASWVASSPASHAVPTTLSWSNGALQSGPRPRRRGLAVGATGALIVAGVVALAAIRASATGTGPQAVVPETRAAAAAQPTPPPAAVDARPARAMNQIREVLVAFSRWAPSHAGAPCPSLDDLSTDGTDPWGNRLAITCTGQPEGQRLGVRSAGPDGRLDTGDDVASWRLPQDVTNLAAGARWITAPVALPMVTPPAAPTRRPISKAQPKPVTSPVHSAAAAGVPAVTISPATPVSTPTAPAPVPALVPAPPAPTPPTSTPPSPPLIGSDGVIRKR